MNNPHSFSPDEIGTVIADGHHIHFLRRGSGWRYETLMEKEPETIDWMRMMMPWDTMWDIGANVGIYTLFAAARGVKVHAFEPHFANYFQLCANVMLNNLQEKVTPLCVAFSDKKSVGMLNLASTDFGTSMSSFGNNLDFRGRPFNPAFKQGMVGYDIDSFVREFDLKVPNHMKIDVDGLELNILKGAVKTLENRNLKSISIELIDTDEAQISGVNAIMDEAGFSFIHKKQNAAFAVADTKDVLNFLYLR